MNDHDFKKLLAAFGYSWEGYRRVRKGVKKRIVRHMQAAGCRHIDVYLERLAVNAADRRACDLLLCVSISRFFRDHLLWEVLEKDVLPMLSDRPEVRIWSAGCAGGEEVYSLSIIRDRFQKRYGGAPKISIIATDKHPDHLERARQGEYSRGSLRELDDAWRQQYFTKVCGKKLFAVRPYLKADIRWQLRNLESAMVGESFDIILLRNNLLTYYSGPHKDDVFRTVTSRLKPGGYLITGMKETLPDRFAHRFSAHPACRCLFLFEAETTN